MTAQERMRRMLEARGQFDADINRVLILVGEECVQAAAPLDPAAEVLHRGLVRAWLKKAAEELERFSEAARGLEGR